VTEYLTLHEVLVIHDRLVDEFGGAEGVRDGGALESALFRPMSGYYEDVLGEAAALLESLLVNHPFVDGNKRTAYAVTDIFLRLNGWHLRATTDDAHQLILTALAERHGRFDRLAAWLCEHAHRSA
jgi:death-on-curing protein